LYKIVKTKNDYARQKQLKKSLQQLIKKEETRRKGAFAK